jgi:CHAD domain-containing protein
MAFWIKADESLGQGLRRIANELIDDCLVRLASPDAVTPDDIHAIRKNCKKQRAILRMMRRELGNRRYRRENRFYRDLSREFASVRESAVALQMLEALIEETSETISPTTFTGLRTRLQENHHTQSDLLFNDTQRINEATKKLQAARDRIDKWTVQHRSDKVVKAGLKLVYSRGYAALDDVDDQTTAEALHEWRKSVKYLWYHLQIIQPTWPDGIEPQVQQLDRLGDLLGLDHDYAELKTILYQLPEASDNTDDVMTLIYTLDAKRKALQAEALYLGRRFFAEKPDAFVRRHREYWRVWSSEQNTVR